LLGCAGGIQPERIAEAGERRSWGQVKIHFLRLILRGLSSKENITRRCQSENFCLGEFKESVWRCVTRLRPLTLHFAIVGVSRHLCSLASISESTCLHTGWLSSAPTPFHHHNTYSTYRRVLYFGTGECQHSNKMLLDSLARCKKFLNCILCCIFSLLSIFLSLGANCLQRWCFIFDLNIFKLVLFLKGTMCMIFSPCDD
jgi:hypothetical protein